MVAVFRSFLVIILFCGWSAAAYDLDASAKRHSFTPLSPFAFQELTRTVREAGFNDLLIKAQRRLGLRDMSDLRNYLGTCKLPENFGGKILGERLAVVLPRLEPKEPQTWLDLVTQYNSYRAAEGEATLSATNPIQVDENHFHQSYPGYYIMTMRLPRVCLNPNQSLRRSALYLVHELTHLVYLENPGKEHYFQFNGFTEYLDHVLTGPGGELVAHQNEFLAARTLALGPKPDYSELWRQLYTQVGIPLPKSMTVQDPYPLPDRAVLLLALIKNYSDHELKKFADGLVQEVSLHVTKINKAGEVATDISNRYWRPDQVREYSEYISAIKKHRDDLLAELQSIKMKYKGYIRFQP